MTAKRNSPTDIPRNHIVQERHKSEEREHAFARDNSATLNALPLPIAVVDVKGVILFVNDAWKRFVIANVLNWKQYGVGSNYLTICKPAHGGCKEEWRAVAEGLRTVLAGKQKSFALEYPCHTPSQERWFRVIIRPMSETEAAGAVVMHLNVTERRRVQEAGRLSHKVFHNSPDHIAVVGRDYRYYQVNQGYEVAHGIPSQTMRGRHIADVLGKETFQKVIKPNFDRALTGVAGTNDSWVTFRNLGERFMSVTYSPLESHNGDIQSVMVVARDITERKRAEDALMKSEARLRLAMGAANVGTWLWDISSNLLTWSENVEELFGLAPGTFSGTYQGYLDLIHPADLPLIQNAIAETLEHDAPYEVEYRVIWPDGSIHWLSSRGNVFRDASTGNPDSVAGTVADITERKRTEEALAKEQQFTATVLDTARALIVVLDPQWRIVRVNRMCEELTGKKSEKIQGRFFLELSAASEGNFGTVRSLLKSFKSGQFPSTFENAWVGKDRKLLWVSWANTVMHNERGEVENIIVTGVDITSRKQAEEAILESRTRVEGIIRTAIDAIITIDNHHRIVVFNPAAEAMFGCTAEQAIGQSLDQFIPRRFRKAHHRSIREFGQTGVTPRVMGRLGKVYGLRANGEEFPLEASISKVGVGKLKLYTVILRDITVRIEAEQALTQSQERLDLALKGANLGVWDWNMQTKEVHHDKRWMEMLGYTPDELEPTFETWEQRLHPQDKPSVLKTLQKHLDGLAPLYQTEYRLRTKHGTWKWILDTGKVVRRDPRGKPLRITGTHQDITNRKEAEQELVKEREFIKAVLETAGALVVVLDRQGRIVRFNRACEQLTGYSFQEVQGKPIWDLLLLPEETPAIKKVFRALRQGNLSKRFENYWVTKEKKTKWIAWSNTTLADDKGKVKYVIGTGIDITERRKAEQEINRLWNQNALILASAGEGIYGINRHGETTFFNRAAEHLTGWTWQEVNGQALHPLLHHTKPDGNPYRWEECPVYLSLRHGSTHLVGTEVLWRKDNTSFPVEYTSTPIKTEKKTIEGVVVTFQDITDRKKAEEALRESEERFQAFMNHSPAVAFLKDERGRYLYMNQTFERLFNKPTQECLGKTDEHLFPHEIARALREHDREALRRGRVLEAEETTLDDRGVIRHWLVFKFPVRSTDERLLLGGVALDITLRKQAEEALRQRESELQNSQKVLQELGGQLISAQENERRRISRELHDDMNQRLAVLAFNIQTAQKEFAESAPMYHILQKLYDEVSSISDDVRHLAYQLHPSILDDLGLEVAVQSFVHDFAKWEGIPVTFTSVEMTEPLPQDIASCLYRVTQECLRNVARHAEATQVDVNLTGEHTGIRMSIKDNGKGFKAEDMRAGKPGLGLIGMRERVRVVQGTYAVKSDPGQGTEITVWVPLSKGHT